jgi:hypothetical protein
MTKASMLNAGLLDRSPTAGASVECLRPNGYAWSAARSTILPTVERGQLWRVEFPSTEPQFAPLEYRALQTANVLVYDRVLTEIVARFLPLGSYAEPAGADDGAFDTALERSLRFVRDGWSVVRLVDYQETSEFSDRQRMANIRRFSKRLLATKGLAHAPVSIFANSGDALYETSEAALGGFAQLIEGRASTRSQSLTIVFGVLGGETAPCFSAASSNGLAG